MKKLLNISPLQTLGRAWKTVVSALVITMAIFQPLLTTAQTGTSGTCTDFNASYSISYNASTQKTTLLFDVKINNGVDPQGKGISHIDFAFCSDPQSVRSFSQLITSGNYVAQYSSDGNTWNTATTVFGPDGSASDCIGNASVFKFNNGVGTATKYRLIIDGNWQGTPDYIMVKYGNNCCVTQLTEQCFGTYCVPPSCPIISLSSTEAIFVGQSRTYSIPAQPADVTFSWSIVSPIGAIQPIVQLNATGDAYTVTYNQTGDYTVKITLSNGPNCETICSVPLSVVPMPAVFEITASPYCSNDATKGTVSVTGGGENGVTYCLRLNGSDANISCQTKTIGVPVVFTNLVAGDYTVYATTNPAGITLPDAQGATNNPQTVIENAAPQLSATSLNVTCNGNANGSINLTVTVPQGVQYLVQWTKDGQNYSTDEDLTTLAPGEYEVTVTTQANCVATKKVTITQPPVVSITATSTNVTCNGEANGTITVTSSAPAEASITISKDGGAPAAYVAGGSYGPGSYELIASVPNGNNDGVCTAKATVNITEPPVAVTVVASKTNVTCNGDADGTITLTTLTPQDATVTISKDGGAAVPYVAGSSYGPGVYLIVASVPNGLGTGVCSATSTVTITEPKAVSISATATDVTCNGAANGTITVTDFAPAEASITISKDGGAAVAYDAGGSYGPGVYKLIASVPNGEGNGVCSAETTVTIAQPPVLGSSKTSVNVLCNGGANGSIDLSVTGGTPTYSYAWTASNGGVILAGQEDDEDLTGLVAGTYSVTITDANGCTTQNSATITQPAVFTCRISATSEVCTGSSTTYTVSTANGTGATYEWEVTGTFGSWNGSGSSITVSSGTALGSYTVKVKVTSTNGCVSTCETSTQVVNCTVCTYTQGYYGNPGGTACFDDAKWSTQGAIKAAINKAGPDGTVGSEVFGLAPNRSFTLVLADIVGAYDGTLGAPNWKLEANNNIFKMLPGGGNSQAIGSYIGGARYAIAASWSVVPLDNTKANKGKIRNTLLAQTIPLFVSLQNSKDLGALQLQNYVVVTRDVECGTKILMGSPMEFQFPKTVIDFLNGGYGNTVNDLYRLANAYLGGQTPGNLNIGDVAAAVDKLNNAFDGCRAATGWLSAPSVQRTITTTAPAAAINLAKVEVEDESMGNVEVKAYPNPFVDKVLFTIQPKVSGQAQLDIFDMTGRKIQTPFNGYLKAGQKQTVEVKMNTTSDGIIIYRLNTGGGQTSGRLMRLK